jgi:hypothetical protein
MYLDIPVKRQATYPLRTKAAFIKQMLVNYSNKLHKGRHSEQRLALGRMGFVKLKRPRFVEKCNTGFLTQR